MVVLLILGICAAVAAAGEIVSKLAHKESISTLNYTIPSGGFEKMFSYSDVTTMTVATSKAGTMMDYLAKKVGDMVPDGYAKTRSNLASQLDDMSSFESYLYDNSTVFLNSMEYSKRNGKLFFISMMFIPQGTDKVIYKSFDVSATLQLEGNFFVTETSTKQWLTTAVKHSVQEKDPGLTEATVSDAISIALAPGMFGLFEIPPELKNYFEAVAKKNGNQVAAGSAFSN